MLPLFWKPFDIHIERQISQITLSEVRKYIGTMHYKNENKKIIAEILNEHPNFHNLINNHIQDMNHILDTQKKKKINETLKILDSYLNIISKRILEQKGVKFILDQYFIQKDQEYNDKYHNFMLYNQIFFISITIIQTILFYEFCINN